MPDESFPGLPEVMASLRRVGSARSTRGQAEPLRFFAPLLEARRAAARARSRAEAVAAFPASSLNAAIRRVLTELAGERFASHPPARRAFEAELEDVVEPLRAALVRLGELAPAARAQAEGEGEGEASDAAWQAWLAQLRTCFAAADTIWPALDAALAPRAGEGQP